MSLRTGAWYGDRAVNLVFPDDWEVNASKGTRSVSRCSCTLRPPAVFGLIQTPAEQSGSVRYVARTKLHAAFRAIADDR
jgi:hypothetical protein